jgi:hypothetical protein
MTPFSEASERNRAPIPSWGIAWVTLGLGAMLGPWTTLKLRRMVSP